MKKKNAFKRKSRKRQQSVSMSTNAYQLKQALSWLLGDSVNQIATHGNTKWQPISLVRLALFWSISGASTLGKAFEQAHNQALSLFGSVAVSTYQGLLKALVIYGPPLRRAVSRNLQERMQELMGSRFKVSGWVPFAIDGSTARPRRTKSNEKAFVAANYGRGATAKHRKLDSQCKPSSVKPPAPRILITMIWQMTARLPWTWKLGRAGTGERSHALQMIENERFAKGAIFVADAGFVGYVFWKAIIDRKFSFLIRVGKNVQFLQDHKNHIMVRKNRVYYWPNKQSRSHEPPLVLRLIRVTIGNRKMALVTNVLEPSRLNDKIAILLYKMRWGIELEFRGLKQIFQRGKLRSKNADRCEQELDWSILAMSIVECYTLKLLIEKSPAKKVPKISFAIGLSAFQDSLEKLNDPTQNKTLNDRIARATPDSYQRQSIKQGRHRPSGKSRPPTGLPVVVSITREQRLQLKEIQLAIAV